MPYQFLVSVPLIQWGRSFRPWLDRPFPAKTACKTDACKQKRMVLGEAIGWSFSTGKMYTGFLDYMCNSSVFVTDLGLSVSLRLYFMRCFHFPVTSKSHLYLQYGCETIQGSQARPYCIFEKTQKAFLTQKAFCIFSSVKIWFPKLQFLHCGFTWIVMLLQPSFILF